MGRGSGGSGVRLGRLGRTLRPQALRQKSTSAGTMWPVRERQPSSQISWLRLQLGRRARRRSMMTNLGCMTEKGRMKTDLIWRSRPRREEGGGMPSFEAHVEGG